MEWIAEPQPNNATLYDFCIYRVCSNKSFCDGYFCFILNCGKNKQ